MGLNVGNELAALPRMAVTRLREQYAGVFGEATATATAPAPGSSGGSRAISGRVRPVR